MLSSERPAEPGAQQRGVQRTVLIILTVIVVFTALFFWRILRTA